MPFDYTAFLAIAKTARAERSAVAVAALGDRDLGALPRRQVGELVVTVVDDLDRAVDERAQCGQCPHARFVGESGFLCVCGARGDRDRQCARQETRA